MSRETYEGVHPAALQAELGTRAALQAAVLGVCEKKVVEIPVDPPEYIVLHTDTLARLVHEGLTFGGGTGGVGVHVAIEDPVTGRTFTIKLMRSDHVDKGWVVFMRGATEIGRVRLFPPPGGMLRCGKKASE